MRQNLDVRARRLPRGLGRLLRNTVAFHRFPSLPFVYRNAKTCLGATLYTGSV
jgi:hypothetical protein